VWKQTGAISFEKRRNNKQAKAVRAAVGIDMEPLFRKHEKASFQHLQTRTHFLFEKLRNEHSSAFAMVDTFMLRNADEQRRLDSVRDDGKRYFRSLQIELNPGAEKGLKEAQKRKSRALATGERTGRGNDSR
jgi:hypothetical protein